MRWTWRVLVNPMRRDEYVRGLQAALRGVALPYGYTVTVWSSGQQLIHARGTPQVWAIFLFAAGAGAAFGTLRTLTPDAVDAAEQPLGARPHFLRATVIQLAAIAAAIGAAGLVGLIPSPIAWPLGGFAATGLYLAGVAVELGLRAADPLS